MDRWSFIVPTKRSGMTLKPRARKKQARLCLRSEKASLRTIQGENLGDYATGSRSTPETRSEFDVGRSVRSLK